jgi:[acyl-carrier-protein] S-malonyltransferase
VIETILVDLLFEQGQQPDFVAGHSLGEYVALYAAGVFNFEEGLHLVKRRAELMDISGGGAMAAVMQFDRQQLDDQVQQIPNVVIANDNSPNQVVISGSPEALDALLTKITAKRVVRLNVSGAFHSPLMAEAATQFDSILGSVAFQTARIPVLSNVEPQPEMEAPALKERLRQQMTGPVRWREIALYLASLNVGHVIEVGPGKVLTGLMKRTCKELTLSNISSVAELPQHG